MNIQGTDSIRSSVGVLVACLCLCYLTARGQSFDQQLEELATTVSKSLQDGGRKKVSVLDFMDLQGNATEIGRFMAEQFSVALVISRKDFAVMDRANLKTILAEHKLSISGLVEPENAKKLGQFSGVDTIILGSITPLNDEMVVTVKVIATDTAEIVGAARTRIKKTKEMDGMMAVANPVVSKDKVSDEKKGTQVVPSAPLDMSGLVKVEKNAQKAGPLFVKIESIKIVKGSYDNFYRVTVIVINTKKDGNVYVTLERTRSWAAFTSKDGNAIDATRDEYVSGIGTQFADYTIPVFSEIEPERNHKFTLDFMARDDSDLKNPSGRVQFVLGTTSKAIRGKKPDEYNRYSIMIDTDTKN